MAEASIRLKSEGFLLIEDSKLAPCAQEIWIGFYLKASPLNGSDFLIKARGLDCQSIKRRNTGIRYAINSRDTN